MKRWAILKSWGIEITEECTEYHHLFYKVKLPTGWRIKPKYHSSWYELLDDQGNIRIKIFAVFERNRAEARYEFIDEELYGSTICVDVKANTPLSYFNISIRFEPQYKPIIPVKKGCFVYSSLSGDLSHLEGVLLPKIFAELKLSGWKEDPLCGGAFKVKNEDKVFYFQPRTIPKDDYFNPLNKNTISLLEKTNISSMEVIQEVIAATDKVMSFARREEVRWQCYTETNGLEQIIYWVSAIPTKKS